MARIVFKLLRVSSLTDPKIADVQKGESFIDESTGTLYYRQFSTGSILSASSYTHPTTDGYLHVPATSTINNGKVLKAGAAAGSLGWSQVDWSEITNKPTIPTNAVAANTLIVSGTATKISYDTKGLVTGSSTLLPTDIPNLDWSKITSGKPTTLSGFSITDAYTKSEVDLRTSVATTTTLGIVKVGTGLSIDASGILSANVASLAWSNITGKPTTLSGFGITDAATTAVATQTVSGLMSTLDKVKLDNLSSTVTAATTTSLGGVKVGTGLSVDLSGLLTANAQAWTTITGKPTTYAALGIGDIASTAVASTISAGLLSAIDKTKLDGIATGANLYVHPASGVTAGTYTKVSVDINGHVTAGVAALTSTDIPVLDASKITTGTLTNTRLPAFTGDATVAVGTSTIVLSPSGATAGTYQSVVVDAKGRVTSGTNPTTVAGFGITDVYTKTEVDAKVAAGGGGGTVSLITPIQLKVTFAGGNPSAVTFADGSVLTSKAGWLAPTISATTITITHGMATMPKSINYMGYTASPSSYHYRLPTPGSEMSIDGTAINSKFSFVVSATNTASDAEGHALINLTF